MQTEGDTLKFYIASRLSERPKLVKVASALVELGHVITSKWIYDVGDAKDSRSALKVAIRDLCHIAEADILLIDTVTQVAQDGGAGKEAEFGFAMSYYQYKQVWRIGPVKNVFHTLADESWATWNEFLEFMREGKSASTKSKVS